jgi:hypothetical protein
VVILFLILVVVADFGVWGMIIFTRNKMNVGWDNIGVVDGYGVKK